MTLGRPEEMPISAAGLASAARSCVSVRNRCAACQQSRGPKLEVTLAQGQDSESKDVMSGSKARPHFLSSHYRMCSDPAHSARRGLR